MKHFTFDPIDSWFFRESRSMDGAGSTALNSVFPPPNNTLMGAIRTHIGNAYHAQNNSSWEQFNAQHELASIIGYGQDYAQLKAQGAWLYRKHDQQCYLPCPKNLVEQGDELAFFSLGDGIECDLGKKVKLAQLKRERSQKPLEQTYISALAFSALLAGNAPKRGDVIGQQDIFDTEPRLGIARDNQRRKTIDGKLYQTNHIRLRQDWSIYLGVSGDDKLNNLDIPNDTVHRLGGEARMAHLHSIGAPNIPQKLQATHDTQALVLYLATPLPDQQRPTDTPMLPGGHFERKETEDATLWQGELLGETITIESAITDKVLRLGGWDMAKRQSLPVRSFIPAGSCWYLKTDHAQKVIDALHGQYLTNGSDRALGYGQIFIGLAPHTHS